MEKNSEILEVINSINKEGKTVCPRCGKNYDVKEKRASEKLGFWCEECGYSVHTTPADIIVE